MTNTTQNKGGDMVNRGPAPRITPDAVEEVFSGREDRAEPLTAKEVGDVLDCSRRTALNRLHDLEEADAVASKKVGGRAKVWWKPLTEPETPPSNVSVASEETDADAGETTHAAVYDDGAIFPDLRDRLPGDGSNLDGRINAVREIYDYLKEHGRGQKSDFEAVVDVEATGYTGKDPYNSFWTNCINASGVLVDLPGVEAPGEGGHTYRYVGDSGE